MNFSVTQDPAHPEGGYAVLRFFGIGQALDDARLTFQPLDETNSENENWPRGTIPAVECRLLDGALEVTVGPEVVNRLPADAALQVALTGQDPNTGRALDFKGECRWPALVPQSQRRRGRLPEVKRPDIAEATVTGDRRLNIPPRSEAVGSNLAFESTDPGSRTMLLAGDPRPLAKDPADKAQAKAIDDVPIPVTFGRNAVPPPAREKRSGLIAWASAALLLGMAIGFGGGRFLAPTPDPVPPAESPPPTAETSDRTLMRILDSADTASDGALIFRTSKDDLWTQAAQHLQERDFTGATALYRMAMRVSLSEGQAPALLAGLAAALQSRQPPDPQIEASLRVLLSLMALAGDSDAFCRLASSYAGTDDEYARSLRERARLLTGPGSAQGC